ncbi:MAG: hypothetical protein WCX23_00730 [Candidatus Paceibacterota bacterium]|jgi:hypothetical protein|nr:hypothetical protein [Candidatus Paceibacterota bacterium]MDD4830816.1 hypothetical protein [Candidatus Paceibacterota bacterium]MDD4874897.1 hypothetical protein [Candidatus Paceibacterota bacterium]
MIKKTDKILFFSAVVFISLFFSASFCSAAFDLATPIIIGFLQIACQIVLFLTSGILGLAGGFLEIMASPQFIAAKFTSNEFVALGTNITLGFANIVILLSLLAIGIGTALRLDKFDARKNFSSLLIVIFLINFFAPLFCGLIIDASNIVMNFFIGSGFSASKVLSNALAAQGNNLASHANGLATIVELLNLKFLMQTVIMIVFNLSLAIVLFLFGLLFVMRYAALWTLVILSPLAFSCYILPSTRKIFNTWMNQFVNWCFVGAIASFFLYLGQQLIGLISQGNLVLVPPGQSSNWYGMESVMPYIVAIIFLFIGFFFSLSSSAMGSGAVIGYAQGQTKKLGNWGARRFIKAPAKEGGKDAVRSRATEKVAKGISSLGSSLSPSWGEGEKGVSGWAKRQAAKGLGVPGRALGGAGAALSMERDKQIGEITKKAEEMKTKELKGALKGGSLGEKGSLKNGLIVASFLTDKDEGKNKEAREKIKVMNKGEIEAMVRALLKEGKNKEADAMGRISLLMKKTKDLKEIGFKELSPEEREKNKEWKNKWSGHADRLIDTADIDTIKKYGGDISESEEMMASAARLWGQGKVKAAAEQFEDKFIKKYCEAADNIGFKEMLKENPGAVMFRISSAAQDAGFTPPVNNEGKLIMKKEEVQAIRREIKTQTGSFGLAGPHGEPISQFKKFQSSLKDAQRDLEKEVKKTEEKKERRNPPRGTETGPKRSDKRPPGT